MPYALEIAKNQIAELLREACGDQDAGDLGIKGAPPNVDADLAVPLFALAKGRGQNPAQLTQELAGELSEEQRLSGTLFSKVSGTGGFLNFKLDPKRLTTAVLDGYRELGENYGRAQAGAGKTVVIDFSSPNIAKPFSVGHLRSTVIGAAIAEILRFRGYEVIGDNHIGDWGTQFGKLMYAFDAWGDRTAVEAKPIEELLALYVRFHNEAEEDPALEAGARKWFQRLEAGDEEAVALWTWFRDVSLKEFEEIYELLGVSFQEVLGESFYNDRLQGVVDDAFRQGVAEWGAIEARPEAAAEEDLTLSASAEPAMEKVAIISLEDHGIETPLLIQKSDGTSLYATRDLATARYRIERWQPEQILYVVGGEQKLYFRQLFAALDRLSHHARYVHVPFGLIRLPKGRMSTRKGRVIFLEDVLAEAISRAEAILQDRDLSLQEKRRIATLVGVGAVKFADLSQSRVKDVLFDWDKMLNMQGDSAPYLQYACVRIKSILRKAATQAPEALALALAEQDGPEAGELLAGPSAGEEAIGPAVDLVLELARFPETVEAAAETYQPHLVASYLITLARTFSSFYKQVPVLKAASDEQIAARLQLCRMTAQVLENGLGLLGIQCPERM